MSKEEHFGCIYTPYDQTCDPYHCNEFKCPVNKNPSGMVREDTTGQEDYLHDTGT